MSEKVKIDWLRPIRHIFSGAPARRICADRRGSSPANNVVLSGDHVEIVFFVDEYGCVAGAPVIQNVPEVKKYLIHLLRRKKGIGFDDAVDAYMYIPHEAPKVYEYWDIVQTKEVEFTL